MKYIVLSLLIGLMLGAMLGGIMGVIMGNPAVQEALDPEDELETVEGAATGIFIVFGVCIGAASFFVPSLVVGVCLHLTNENKRKQRRM